jgi:hypothetical protein
MAEPRKADDVPATDAVKHTAKASRVRLRTAQKYMSFEPGNGLEPVGYSGTDYTSAQADEVRTAARKHGVRVVVVQPAQEA